MNQFQYHLYIIFSCLMILFGCSKPIEKTTPVIEAMDINQGNYTYDIHINNKNAGESSITIINGVLRTFNGNQYLNCTYIREDTTINGVTGSHFFFAQKLVDGYLFLSDDINEYTTKHIPFPLKIGDQLFGPFSSISTENIYVTVTEHLPSFKNMSNHVFNDVVKASDATGLIDVYLNESHYVIQKEDHRYAPTIQSLNLN